MGPELKSVPPSTGGGAAFGYALAMVGSRRYVGSPLEVNYTADDVNDPLGGYNVTSIDAVDPSVPDDSGLLRQTVEPSQTPRGSDMEAGSRFGSSPVGGGVALSGERAAVVGDQSGSGDTLPDGTVTYGVAPAAHAVGSHAVTVEILTTPPPATPTPTPAPGCRTNALPRGLAQTGPAGPVVRT